MTTHHRRRRLLPSLDALTDAQLHAVLVRVQTLLLNRPHSRTRLAVDLVNDDEVHLLTLYRVLPPLQRHAILAVVEQSGAQVIRTQEGTDTMPSPDEMMRTPT
jgi:hypothetical protein